MAGIISPCRDELPPCPFMFGFIRILRRGAGSVIWIVMVLRLFFFSAGKHGVEAYASKKGERSEYKKAASNQILELALLMISFVAPVDLMAGRCEGIERG